MKSQPREEAANNAGVNSRMVTLPPPVAGVSMEGTLGNSPIDPSRVRRAHSPVLHYVR